MRREFENLSRIYEHGLLYIRGESRGTEFFEMIEERDYLTAHFPDNLHKIPQNPDFAKRLLLSTEGYRSYLERLIGIST